MRKILSLAIAALFSATMFATNSYWLAGSANSWTGAAMTVSAKGYYEYFLISKQTGTLQFKIQLAEGVWEGSLGRNYTSAGYASTDVTNMNSASTPWDENKDGGGNIVNDNVCIYYDTQAFYVIVFKPSTEMNATANPIICASTSLPDENEPVVTKYYLKNGWDGGEWTWKEMTQDGDNYKLENVVFGGGGVNYNTAASGDGTWVALDAFKGATIGVLDTVTLVLDPSVGTITATLLGKYVAAVDPNYYLKNNWDAGESWTWKEMTKDGTVYKLENVVFGGSGVNYNIVQSETGQEWIAVDDFLGAAIKAKDTVTLVFDPSTNKITATLLGAYKATFDNGYYLMGSAYSWAIAATNKFAENGSNPGEYKLENVALALDDEIRVAYVENDAAVTWFGSGNIVIDAKYVGTRDIYFKPTEDPGWTLLDGHLWMGENGGTGINDIENGEKAAKELRNGQLFIIKGEKTYNVLGQEVR